MTFTLPYTFSPGSKAVAEEVNSNFASCRSAILDNESRINENINDISDLDATKAEMNGDKNEEFSVAEPTDSAHAVNLDYFNENTVVAISRSLLNSKVVNAGTDSSHDVTISAGQNASIDCTDTIELTSSLTKQIDTGWVKGSEQGGFVPYATSTAVMKDETYHVILFKGKEEDKEDAEYTVVDACFIHYSAMQDEELTALGIQAIENATGLYQIKYRRLKSEMTDADAYIVQTVQCGDTFYRPYITDISNLNKTSYTSYDLSVPNGVNVCPIGTVWSQNGNFYVRNEEETIENHLKYVYIASYSADAKISHQGILLPTTTASLQFKVSSTSTYHGNLSLVTNGYIDSRGK